MELFESGFLNQLKRDCTSSWGTYITNTKENKEYIRDNGCTYKRQIVYGGMIAVIRDKRTNEVLEMPILEEEE